MAENKSLARVAGLLRQAERTGNEHEAASFLAAAQRIASASAIDLEVARQHTRNIEKRATPVERAVRIGEPGKRGLRAYVKLFLGIAAANDVTCDIAHNSATVYAFGFEADIDLVEQLYTSLLVQMVKASTAFLATGAYKNDLVRARVRRKDMFGRVEARFEIRPVSAVTARLNFQLAYAQRIRALLAAARAAENEKAAAAPVTVYDTKSGTDVTTSTELVLASKQLEVADFYKQHSEASGSWRGGRTGRARYSSTARAAGDAAARRAQLSARREIGGSRPALAS